MTTSRRLEFPYGNSGVLGTLVEQPSFVDVGIELPIGAERDGVLQAIIAQVASVAELLAL